MKKILLSLLVLISLFWLSNIKIEAKVEYSDKTCEITPSGKIKVLWDGDREEIGVVKACVYDITVTEEQHVVLGFGSSEEAEKDCSTTIHALKPSCCTDSDPKTSCPSYYKYCEDKTYKCTIKPCEKKCYLCGSSFKWGDTYQYNSDSSCTLQSTITTKSACENSRIVYFNARGGSLRVNSKVVTNGGTYGFLPTPSHSNNKCSFTGWYTASTSGTHITASSRVNITSTQTLYAHWSCRPGGGGPINDEVSMKKNDITIMSKILTKSVIDNSSDGSGSTCGSYYYTYTTYKSHVSGNCIETTKPVTTISYKTKTAYEQSSGDSVYCLQPGRKGPGKAGINYVENKSFDVLDCKDQFTLKDGTKRVECGLANVLYQTVKFDEASNRYVPNGKYTDGEITFALRLWMAAYSGNSGIGLGDISSGSDDPEVEWVPKEDFYKKTADAIKGNKLKLENLDAYNTNVKTNGGAVGCKNGKKDCKIMKAIELFKKAESATEFDYLGGTEFIKEDPKITYTQLSRTEEKIIIDLPEAYQEEEIEVECKDIKEKGCRVKIEIKDEDGNVLPDDAIQSGYCTKERCIIIVSPPMKKCTQYSGVRQTIKFTVTVTLRQYREPEGWVRFYLAEKNPGKYQIMISFLYKKKYCEDQVTESQMDSTYTKYMYVECGCEDRCENFVVKKDLPSSCNMNNEYSSGKVEDPNMNCIINACFENDKNKYDYSSKLGVNQNICKVYCRDEVELYLPSKATTYAGMQFSYDLGNTLKNKDKISQVVSGNINSPKLSAVVKNKKQCTSEINYSYWEEQYQKLLSGNKDLVDQWLYYLYNCNLYSNSDIPTKISGYNKATSKGTSKDYIINQETCSSDECLDLTVNYADNAYGENNKLAKSSKVLGTVKTYYCTDTDSKPCYKYEENKEVKITGENKTKGVDYKTGKITVPTNDYASITIESQNDFYQSKQYQVEAYSGLVSEGDGNDGTHTLLAPNVYPVSNNVPTGRYDINFTFGKLPYKNTGDSYSYSCKYDVYNTTVLYDCSVIDESGKIDLSRCGNECYEIKDGVPVFDSSCMNWEPTDKKQYGFVYRNVELNNLFPNAVVDESGISTRNGVTNWSTEQQTIEDIQNSASTIFTDDDKYLEARFVLTPQSIKEIKQYNKEAKSKGGYNNSTLEDCEKIKVGNIYLFKNCKSTFLKDIKNYTGVQVMGIEGGAN